MSTVKKISKRAAHKAAVAARKDQPVVKLRKQRRNPPPFPSDFFAQSRESEREGVLLTQVSRKPPTYRAETVSDSGQPITVALQKSPRPTRGWNVLLPKGERMHFRTRRLACKFIGLLQAEPTTAANEAANGE